MVHDPKQESGSEEPASLPKMAFGLGEELAQLSPTASSFNAR